MKSLSLKKRTDEYRFFFVLFLFCSLLFLSACSESQVELEEKLDFTLQDDLKWIVPIMFWKIYDILKVIQLECFRPTQKSSIIISKI